eukprot:GILK01006998.1.p1 GENE.GILK01006998.1~~GILK01006998.1.p1  ORF type:complete len:1239 (+),score=161.70 GILK01006998.1:69-3785(+)
MSQLRLVPSGCQSWNRLTTAAGGGRFAYCSTLAIYFYRLQDHTVEKVIAGHERTITGLTWSPHQPNFVCSCSADFKLSVWDLENETEFSSFMTAVAPLQIHWSFHDADMLAVAMENGDCRLWNFRTNAFEKLFNVGASGIKALRWHPTAPGKLICGAGDGTIWLFNTLLHKLVKIPAKTKQQPIEDIQWDPLSTNYYLVAYKDGTMYLCDADEDTVLQTFDKQGGGIKGIAWIRSQPGNFITTNDKTGAFRVCNVSHRSPIEVLKVGITGFQNVQFIPFTDKALCSFRNGSVGIYDIAKRKMEFSTQPGHTETIFDSRFKPNDPDVLATASYDSTVKIWNIRAMEETVTLSGQDGILYAVSWAPGNDNRLASVSSKGDIFVWDTEKGTVLTSLVVCANKPIYRCDWSSHDPSLITLGTGDGYCCVLKLEGNELIMKRRLKHPDAVFGVEWSPFNRDQLATGCMDGHVRIFDLSKGSDAPLKTLQAHTGRVFNVVWHPLLPNVLASGSDDRTVRIWDTVTEESKALIGHASNVRALLWNPEVPFVLLSGSWDGTIRVWDTRVGQCCKVITDHHADVYGLSCHPDRPFMFCSSSRDTSLRFFSLEDMILEVRLKVLLQKPWGDVIADPLDIVTRTSAGLALCGHASRRLAQELQGVPLHTFYRKMTQFFSFKEGLKDFWDLVEVILTGKQGAAMNCLLHVNDLALAYKSRAQDLESIRITKQGLGVGAVKREDRLHQAALLHMKLGNFRQYCELMVDLNHWERALAVAPGVSMEYWRKLCDRYTQKLSKEEREDVVPFHLASGNIDKLVNFFVSRDELEDALLVSKIHTDHGYSSTDSSPAADGSARHLLHNKSSEQNNIESSNLSDGKYGHLKEISSLRAKSYCLKAQPILAACAHLAVEDIDGAVQKLIQGHEIELAFALCIALNITPSDHLLILLAKRAERLKLWQMSADMLRKLTNPHFHLPLLASRFDGSGADLNAFYEQCGLQEPSFYLESGRAAEQEGNLEAAIKYYVVGREPREAVNCLLRLMRKSLIEPTWDLKDLSAILEPIGSCQVELCSVKEKAEVLAYAAYFGALKAAALNYKPVVEPLFATVRNLCSYQDLSDFPIDLALVCLQEVTYVVQHNPAAALRKLKRFTEDNAVPPHLQASFEQALHNAQSISEPSPNMPLNQIIVAGSNLPSGAKRHGVLESCITRQIIQGPEVVLEDGRAAVGLAECLMWAKVNPFSPLNTGFRVNPF